MENALDEDTILVSVMYVNNEIGAREPLDAVRTMMKKKAPRALLHTDAIQAYGKYRIYPKREGLTCSRSADIRFTAPRARDFCTWMSM